MIAENRLNVAMYVTSGCVSYKPEMPTYHYICVIICINYIIYKEIQAVFLSSRASYWISVQVLRSQI